MPTKKPIQALLGEATAVMPFDYTRLIFAGLAGYIFFFEVPDPYTIAGAILIIFATLYIARRETKDGRESPPQARSPEP